MKSRPSALVVRLAVVAAGSLPWPSMATAQSPLDTTSLRWGVPTTMPTSARVAVVRGDPTAPGETVFLISMPNGYRIPPHFHPGPTRIAVRQGRLLVGMGDKVDAGRAKALGAGDSLTIPAERRHYWMASGPTLAFLTFTGPFTITYLRADDAPRPRAFPIGY